MWKKSPKYLDENWGHTFPHLIQERPAFRGSSKGSGKYPPLPALTLSLAALKESTHK